MGYVLRRTAAGWPLVLLVVIACVGLTACGGGSAAQQVSVQGTEFRYDPANATVNAGSSVQVTLRNTGTQAHDWTVMLDGQRYQALAQPGQSANVTFTPSAPGTYQVFCDQPGHQAAGMVGQLVVQ